ncbi:MAG TPA: hypothetical protein VJ323_18615 [Bryobacteraceae bacterium]|nr:hypothetical protein [Bryobacteraceae bacterium]
MNIPMHSLSPALLMAIDAVDVIFVTALFVVGALVTLLINPLNSWVDKLLRRNKKDNG